MNDQKQESDQNTRVCPTCGTRISKNATRCLVCGTDLKPESSASLSGTGSKITLSLPLALILLAVFALLAAGMTFAVIRLTGVGQETTPTVTITPTTTQTNTPEPTNTASPEPTMTPLPPIEYTVAEGDTCLALAGFYNTSVRSIIELNSLGTQCLLIPGKTILIPQPTPTPAPTPSATLEPVEATEAACEKVDYTVQANDTLMSIAMNYNVSIQGIKDYNGMTSDTVFEGQVLKIPLCKRITTGPTPTPTLPPPYPAPNLLLPQDGASFSLANDTITLQWASVAQLQENEVYRVMIEDITEGSGTQRIRDTVTDTKYIIPVSFRPNEALPHIFRWSVTTVRQLGTDAAGDPLYESAGAISSQRVFAWSGAAPEPTATP